jgi:hypothetical protein
MRSMVEGARAVKEILMRQEKLGLKRPSHRSIAREDARERAFGARSPSPLPWGGMKSIARSLRINCRSRSRALELPQHDDKGEGTGGAEH